MAFRLLGDCSTNCAIEATLP